MYVLYIYHICTYQAFMVASSRASRSDSYKPLRNMGNLLTTDGLNLKQNQANAPRIMYKYVYEYIYMHTHNMNL
jgi:hypothetical protein